MRHLKSLLSLIIALMLALAMPFAASAETTATLVDENHESLDGAIDINVLESKKLILCIKGSDYDFKGANINLFDANDKRVEKAISFWSGPTSELGHYDIRLLIKPGTLQVGKTYSFKVDCVLKNDSKEVVDTATFSFNVGNSSDDGKDDSKDPEPDQDDSDDKKQDDKDQDKKDPQKGNNGKGDDNGSGSGDNKGSSGKESKGAAAGKTDADDAGKSSDVTPAVRDDKSSKSQSSAQDKESDTSSKKGDAAAQEQVDASVLGAKGTVYSLGDGSSALAGNTAGGYMPLELEVTGIPWLMALLVAILALALPAGVAKRAVCAQVAMRRRSRLRGDGAQCRSRADSSTTASSVDSALNDTSGNDSDGCPALNADTALNDKHDERLG